MSKEKNYPFKDGDEYWTIEENNGNISAVSSCWDDVSEEMHDENPNELYFSSEEEVIYHILKTYK
jgi:hypothetical protein